MENISSNIFNRNDEYEYDIEKITNSFKKDIDVYSNELFANIKDCFYQVFSSSIILRSMMLKFSYQSSSNSCTQIGLKIKQLKEIKLEKLTNDQQNQIQDCQSILEDGLQIELKSFQKQISHFLPDSDNKIIEINKQIVYLISKRISSIQTGKSFIVPYSVGDHAINLLIKKVGIDDFQVLIHDTDENSNIFHVKDPKRRGCYYPRVFTDINAVQLEKSLSEMLIPKKKEFETAKDIGNYFTNSREIKDINDFENLQIKSYHRQGDLFNCTLKSLYVSLGNFLPDRTVYHKIKDSTLENSIKKTEELINKLSLNDMKFFTFQKFDNLFTSINVSLNEKNPEEKILIDQLYQSTSISKEQILEILALSKIMLILRKYKHEREKTELIINELKKVKDPYSLILCIANKYPDLITSIVSKDELEDINYIKKFIFYNPNIFPYLPDKWKNSETIFSLLENSPKMFSFFSDEIKNSREYVVKSVKENFNVIEFVSEKFRDDKEIILIAVKKRGNTLQYASKRLQNDPEVAVEAVKMDGSALQYASKQLQNNPEVVVEAVKMDGSALQYASEEVRRDPNIVLIAISKYGGSYIHADRSLFNDKTYCESVKSKIIGEYHRSQFDSFLRHLQ